MSLKKYHQKRNFKKTAEPKGKLHKNSKVLVFCIQKHDASRLHYDFRLEMEGVLKSWAVPKGPSLNPNDKHLAMMVEDHPYDYRKFEGVIPKGEYGGGNVIVWDEGTYEALGPIPDGMSEEDFLLSQIKNGSIKIVMHGHKLKGEFALVRFKNAGDKAWLLIKHNDEFASKKDILYEDKSVITGLTVDEIGLAKVPKKKVEDKQLKDLGKRLLKEAKSIGEKRAFPEQIKPMLAETADAPFDNKNWVFEVKWDGYRGIAMIKKGKVRLLSRNHISFNNKYPVIVEELKSFGHDAILDGELVVLDGNGKPQFQLMQDFHKRKEGRLMYYVFDLLYLDGYDLRATQLLERKQMLKKILNESDIIKYSDHIEEQGIQLYNTMKKRGYEGVVAKKSDSIYLAARSDRWLKIKNVQTDEAVICGFTQPTGTRQKFGSLVLGVYDNNELRFVGHAGGGFDEEKLKAVHKLLKPLITKKCPFPIEPETNTPATWVKPKLIAEIKYSEKTNEGMFRHPIFLGMRADKDPKDVTGEQKRATSRIHLKKELPIIRGKAELTNLNKIYWPKEGYTKGDLVNYYESVAEYILPYLKDRPISLNRFPNGIEGESFFQKNLINKPDWVKTVRLYSEHNKEDIHWLICNDKDTLLYMANLGSIEINPWNSRYQYPDHPDYAIIDLDPEGVPFKHVIKTAKVVKQILDDAKIESFLKTSGKTGLHILIPLDTSFKYSYEQVKQFAQIIATKTNEKLPDITSITRDPAKRQHRVYVDFLQNIQGQTIASAYCVRPVVGATVSTPLDWKELTDSLDPADFTMKNMPVRLKKKGDLWKPFLKHKGLNILKGLVKLATA